MEALCAGRLKAGPSFWEEFKGASFARRARGLIRTSRTNAGKPSGFRKDVAHFAPGRTCLSSEGGRQGGALSTRPGSRPDTSEELSERLRTNGARLSALIVDHGKECKASRRNTNGDPPPPNANLADFKPPFAPPEVSARRPEKGEARISSARGC